MSELVYAADAWKAWSSLTEGERKLRAYVESFNGKLRNEPLDGEGFTTLLEAQVLVAD